MKLTNVVVQFTVIIPEIEVDKEFGLQTCRVNIIFKAFEQAENDVTILGKGKIIDCPDYPALITDQH